MREDTVYEEEVDGLQVAEDTGMRWGQLKDLPPSRLSLVVQSFGSAVQHAMQEEVAKVIGDRQQ